MWTIGVSEQRELCADQEFRHGPDIVLRGLLPSD
jgi:hypothetical protein